MHIRDTEFIVSTLVTMADEVRATQFLMNRGDVDPDDLTSFLIFMQDHVNSLSELSASNYD